MMTRRGDRWRWFLMPCAAVLFAILVLYLVRTNPTDYQTTVILGFAGGAVLCAGLAVFGLDFVFAAIKAWRSRKAGSDGAG